MAKLIPDPPIPLVLRFFPARKSACVYLNGKRKLLGPWPEHPNPPSQAVQAAFKRIADRWQRGLPIDAPDEAEVSIAVMVDRVLTWADAHYRGTNEAVNLRCSARDLLALFADMLAKDFMPLDLEQLQGYLVRKGHTRSGANKRLGLIRRLFARGVAMGLVGADVLVGLKTVAPVRMGDAPESGTRGAVDDATINATIAHLPPVVAALVRFQRLTGCRPGEAVRVNMGEITRETANLWVYRPAKHKGQWRGKTREIFIGPRGIELLQPWLRADGLPLFSPKATSPNPDAKRTTRQIGDMFRVSSYTHAIAKACAKANVPVWSPNQLRKSRGQELRDTLGLEASAAALGHGVTVSERHYTNAQEQARQAALKSG